MRFFFIISMICFISVTEAFSQRVDSSSIIVLRWSNLPSYNNRENNNERIIQKLFFRHGLKKYLIHYDVEQTKMDSIVFYYDDLNNLIEQVEYSLSKDSVGVFKVVNRIKFYYDNEKKLIDAKNLFNSGESLYQRKYIGLTYRDSLDLLEDEMEDLQTAIENSKGKYLCNLKDKKNTLQITCYNANIRIKTFERYGLPQSAMLNSIKTFTRSNTLLKDEFHFDKFIVKRQYVYYNSFPKKIIVNIKYSDNKSSTYLDRFEYTYPSILPL